MERMMKITGRRKQSQLREDGGAKRRRQNPIRKTKKRRWSLRRLLEDEVAQSRQNLMMGKRKTNPRRP